MMIFTKKKTFQVFLFVFCVLFVFRLSAQDTAAPPAPVIDETTVFLETGTDAAINAAAAQSSGSSIWVLLRVVLVLGIVCAGIYGVVYFLKKNTKINAGNDPYLKNVASLALSPNKSVKIFTVGSQAFIIGVTDQSISLISEIKDTELIDAMNLETDKNTAVPLGSFASVLTSFLPKQLRDKLGVPLENKVEPSASGESASALATTDFLKKQRERIKNGSPE